jgi:polysaccharide export outer membrane protein
MFKTPKDYEFVKDTALAAREEHRLAVDDRITMKLFSNTGFQIVDLFNSVGGSDDKGLNYLIEDSGWVKLPVLGKTNLLGMTAREAEKKLESLYATFFVEPYVSISIINRHVLVFKGESNGATRIPLEHENTNLMEVLAMAGGVSELSKVDKIKIIRGDLHDPEIRLVSLEDLEGLKSSTLTVKSNDIVYIPQRKEISRKFLQEFSPYLSVLSAGLIIYTVYNNNFGN